MKRVFAVFFFFSAVLPLMSQGFDWEYSARMPSDYPRDFYGGSLVASACYNSADFTFTEELIPCCNFGSGAGAIFSAGLSGEFWFDNGYEAISADLFLTLSYSRYTTRATWPTVNYDVTYEFIFEPIPSYAESRICYKRRIGDTRFSFSAGGTVSLLISESNTYSEKIVSPDFETFADGTRKRVISDGASAPYRTFNLLPVIAVGYDMDFGKSRYGSAEIFTSFPLMSRIKDENLRQFAVGVRFKALTAFE